MKMTSMQKDTSGTNDNFIRQSDVKWIEHHKMPKKYKKRLHDGINQAK